MAARAIARNEQHSSGLWGFSFMSRVLVLVVILAVTLVSQVLFSRLSPSRSTSHSTSMRSLSWMAAQNEHKRLDVNPFPDAFYIPWLEGLDPLPSSHSPYDDQWSNSFAICAIMKDENITDVREWLTYYKWLGVNHIFLTDNDSEDGEQMVNQLRGEFPPTFLTVQTEEMEHAQMKHYAWCTEEQRDKYNWIGFFDLDEFLYINGDSLASFMDAYKSHPALSVHWIWMGPDGRTKRPDTGGVLPYYKKCSADADPHVKTIVNTYYVEGVDIHPHNFRYRDNMKSVDENFQEIGPMWKGIFDFKRAGGTDDDCGEMAEKNDPKTKESCFLSAGAISEPATADKIALYHYATKSLEDFSEKMNRGSGMSKGSKGMDYFALISGLQSDSDWCRLPSTSAADCCGDLYPDAIKDL